MYHSCYSLHTHIHTHTHTLTLTHSLTLTPTLQVPLRWLAPECVRRQEYTHRSDVWSFGVTIWEILTFGARPYQDKESRHIIPLLEAGHRLEQPATCTIDLYLLLLQCRWNRTCPLPRHLIVRLHLLSLWLHALADHNFFPNIHVYCTH